MTANATAASELHDVRTRVEALIDRYAQKVSAPKDGHWRHEIAQGVATFVVAEDQGGAVDAARLVLLTARALRAIGEAGLARRIVVCESALARPTALHVSGEGLAWQLGLADLAVSGHGETELAVQAFVRQAVGGMSTLWEESEGMGVLALGGLDPFAARVLGGDPAPGAIARLAVEIREWFTVELQRLSEEQGWSQTPHVLVMEPRHGRAQDGRR